MASLAILAIVAAVVAMALVFAFTNGYNDSAASVATLIACGAATPEAAVIYAAIAGFLGALLSGTAIILTIEGLVVGAGGMTLVYMILSGVAAAIVWNLLSSRFGLPSSSSHAFVGGLVGAGVAANGTGGVLWGLAELTSSQPQLVGLAKIFVLLLVSVGMGLAGGYWAMRISKVVLRNASRSINRPIMRAQWLTAGLLAFAHGANDTQKQMAVIVLALVGSGLASNEVVPLWARLLCALMMALGTLGGGWRIMRTLGRGIYRIRPIHSLDSQIPSTISILVSTWLGAPVSSTQVVSSSVIGVGAAENAREVHWRMGRSMMISWLVTIPACFCMSGAIFLVVRAVTGAG